MPLTRLGFIPTPRQPTACDSDGDDGDDNGDDNDDARYDDGREFNRSQTWDRLSVEQFT